MAEQEQVTQGTLERLARAEYEEVDRYVFPWEKLDGRVRRAARLILAVARKEVLGEVREALAKVERHERFQDGFGGYMKPTQFGNWLDVGDVENVLAHRPALDHDREGEECTCEPNDHLCKHHGRQVDEAESSEFLPASTVDEMEIEERRSDPEFRARLERSIEENKELLERLGAQPTTGEER